MCKAGLYVPNVIINVIITVTGRIYEVEPLNKGAFHTVLYVKSTTKMAALPFVYMFQAYWLMIRYSDKL